jgi:hypothetical protein
MKKLTSVGLSISILVCIILITLLWLWAFRHSLQAYRSPLRAANLSPQAHAAAPAKKVVLVILSGLGYENALALNLPALAQFGRTGASSAMLSQPPTFAQTAWTTLISGAPPETNDAPPFDIPAENLYPLAIDTIFARLHEQNGQTALFGPVEWRYLIPAGQLDHTYFATERGAQADEIILEAALPAITDNQTNLVLVHLTQLDQAARQPEGLAGPAYQQAAAQINSDLKKISTAIDFSDTVLIVLADHGHIESGGHGGAEVEIVWQPFFMVGAKVIPGDYSEIRQTDIAPTLAALLGTAPPMMAQGRILTEMLRLSEYDQAILQLALAEQRVALAEAYQTLLTGQASNAPRLVNDLDYAQATFAQKNIQGAIQLAQLTREEADTVMNTTRTGQIQTGQIIRLLVSALGLLVWFMVMWRRRGYHAGSIVVAAMITLTIYHGLYQLQGYSYSISSFRAISGLPLEIARRSAISLVIGGGFLLIFLILANEGDWIILLGSAYGFSVMVTFIFVLSFCWGYWQNGWALTVFLPAVEPSYWQLAGAVESIMTALLGLLLPWLITTLAGSIYLLRRRMTEPRRSRPKTGTLPGLHW